MRKIDQNTQLFQEADTLTKRYLRVLLRKYRKTETDIYALWLLLEQSQANPMAVAQIITKLNAAWDSITVQIKNCIYIIIKEVYIKTRKKKEDDIYFEEEFRVIFDDLWNQYGNVTHYRLSAEMERRRGYLVEGVLSARDRQDLRRQFDVSLRHLSKLLNQAGDDATLAAYFAAVEAEGFMYGKWVTQRDSRVCPDCRSRDGKLYPIKEIKKLIPLHYNCRCFFIPVLR